MTLYSHSSYNTRIFLEDTDAGGIVYHARFLHFLERARSLYLEERGINSAQLVTDKKGNFVVTKIDIRYKKPGLLGDMITVHTKIHRLLGASIVCEQWVEKMSHGHKSQLIHAMVTLAFFCPLSMRPLRIPDHIRQAFDV